MSIVSETSAKLCHVHIALNHMAWTQYILLLYVTILPIVKLETDHWMSCTLLNMQTYICQYIHVSICVYTKERLKVMLKSSLLLNKSSTISHVISICYRDIEMTFNGDVTRWILWYSHDAMVIYAVVSRLYIYWKMVPLYVLPSPDP